MTAKNVATMDTQLPSLCSTDIESMDCLDPIDNDVMMEDCAIAIHMTGMPTNRTVSPLPTNNANKTGASIVNDLLQCQKDHEWDDVVLLAGPNDDQDSILLDSDVNEIDTPNPGMAFLDDDIIPEPSSTDAENIIDEFLVDHSSDQVDIEMEESNSLSHTDVHPSSNASGNSPQPGSQTQPPSELSSSYPSHDQYTKRLSKLKESMQRSRQSRQSLCMTSSKIERYPRRTSVSQVLHSIESSSYQIDTCFLDPSFLQQNGTLG